MRERVSANDEIDQLYFYITDPRNDGYSAWGQKQRLYEILWYVQERLDSCQSFVGEDEWLEEHAKDKFIKKLSK
jgi:hypothetical protein